MGVTFRVTALTAAESPRRPCGSSGRRRDGLISTPKRAIEFGLEGRKLCPPLSAKRRSAQRVSNGGMNEGHRRRAGLAPSELPPVGPCRCSDRSGLARPPKRAGTRQTDIATIATCVRIPDRQNDHATRTQRMLTLRNPDGFEGIRAIFGNVDNSQNYLQRPAKCPNEKRPAGTSAAGRFIGHWPFQNFGVRAKNSALPGLRQADRTPAIMAADEPRPLTLSPPAATLAAAEKI